MSIITIFVLCDEYLQASKHREDAQCKVSDAEVMTTATTSALFFQGNFEKTISNKAKLLESRSMALGRLFSQEQAIAEMPLKIEHTRVKIENTKARTALAEVDTQLKREKVEALRADRELRERQAMLVEAATEVLKRYANGDDMLEADFVVIDQLKEIGLKIPKKLPAKNQKQTNGVR